MLAAIRILVQTPLDVNREGRLYPSQKRSVISKTIMFIRSVISRTPFIERILTASHFRLRLLIGAVFPIQEELLTHVLAR